MMLSWQNRQSMTVESAMDSLGWRWRATFELERGLNPGALQSFVRAVGLSEEGPVSYTPKGLARMLDAHGPLWVDSDDSGPENQWSHIRIVTAMRGDGTTVTFADPAESTLKTELFTHFARRMEAPDPVRVTVRLGAGIYHF